MPGIGYLNSVNQYGLYKAISASGVVKDSAGTVQAIIVSSHTNGTIKLWDNATAGSGTVLLDTYTYSTGSQYISLWGAKFLNGLYADMNSTTQKITVIYN